MKDLRPITSTSMRRPLGGRLPGYLPIMWPLPDRPAYEAVCYDYRPVMHTTRDLLAQLAANCGLPPVIAGLYGHSGRMR